MDSLQRLDSFAPHWARLFSLLSRIISTYSVFIGAPLLPFLLTSKAYILFNISYTVKDVNNLLSIDMFSQKIFLMTVRTIEVEIRPDIVMTVLKNTEEHRIFSRFLFCLLLMGFIQRENAHRNNEPAWRRSAASPPPSMRAIRQPTAPGARRCRR